MELVPISSVDASAMRWLRTAESPIAFELSSGDRPVARLTWSRPSGSLATLATAGGASTLKRVGYLHPILTARAVGETTDRARVSLHLNYHRIELRGGATYRFHRAGILLPAWKVSTESGTELVHVEPVREGRKLAGGAVIVAPAGIGNPELPLLLGLAWYVIVLAWFEDEALVPLEGDDRGGSAGAQGR